MTFRIIRVQQIETVKIASKQNVSVMTGNFVTVLTLKVGTKGGRLPEMILEKAVVCFHCVGCSIWYKIIVAKVVYCVAHNLVTLLHLTIEFEGCLDGKFP